MSKADDKAKLEFEIEDAALLVPQGCRAVYKTMLRQNRKGREWLTFHQISSGNYCNRSTGSQIMKLVRMGYALESTLETEWGQKRAWRTTSIGEQQLLQAEPIDAMTH